MTSITAILQKAQALHGDNLVSVYASKDTEPSDLRRLTQAVVVFVFKKLSYVDVLRHQPVQAMLEKKGMEGRLFTASEFQTSVDVFPLEFLELKTDCACVAGADILKDIEIHVQNLRHEYEFYLRSALLKIREGITRNVPSTRLIRESLPQFISCFSGLLKSMHPEPEKARLESDWILKLEQTLDLDLNLWHQLSTGKQQISAALMDTYLKSAEEIVEKIDQLPL